MLRLARRYARALFSLAKSENKVDEYEKELELVTGLLETEKAIRSVLTLPVLPLKKRKEILEDIAENFNLTEGMKRFLLLVLENGRMDLLRLIKEIFTELKEESLGIMRGVLYVPMEIEEEEVRKVEKAFSDLMNKKVILKVGIDPSLIGGAKVEFKGLVYDGSLKAQFQRLSKTLLEGL
jgi:F-type H+-transporting ATPase subunit delta